MDTSQKFIKIESASAKLLFGMAIFALILSNSPWANYYDFIRTSIAIYLPALAINFNVNLLTIVNEGLMTIFFLVVSLEIKYEILSGNLSSRDRAVLPGLAAVGGMLIPAGIFSLFNYNDSFALRGWAVPTATDIAFSLAILSLLNHRVSPALKIFLTALAIFDDLGGILIITIFYNQNLSPVYLQLSLACLAVLIVLNVANICRLLPYVLTGIVLWIFLLKSGINPTIAGVALAGLVPIQDKKKPTRLPLNQLKTKLHPFVALAVLPLFAFMNSGVKIANFAITGLDWSCFFGVLLGLLIGKPLGVFGASWLAVKLHLARLPDHARWLDLLGVSIVCGVGFTISLFINSLAFGHGEHLPAYLNATKLGVLAGSFLSGVVGFTLLYWIHQKHRH